MKSVFPKASISRRRQILGWLLLLPMMLALAVQAVVPFGMALIRSVYRGMGTAFVGLENYSELLRNPTFRLAVGNLLGLWAVVLPLNLGIGFVLALACHSARSRKTRVLYFVPAILPAACGVEILSQLFGSPQMTGLVSLLPADWRTGPQAGPVFAGLVLWKGLGYSILILAAALDAIPAEYREAARLEGASAGQIVRSVLLPLLRPAFLLCAVLAVYNSFRCFREALLLGGSHPAQSLYSLQHFLQNNFSNLNFARLEAASVLLVAVPAAVIVALSGLWKGGRPR